VSHADEDKRRRDEIETRNKADQAVYGAERMIKDTGDKLGASDRQAIESAIEELKKVVEGTDAAAIQRALDQLTAAQHKAAEALYRQQAQASGPSSGPSAGAGQAAGGGASSGGKSDVIDAEVVDEGKQ
jgi:molecular chaperone DnaK